jgi:hypothetical protein
MAVGCTGLWSLLVWQDEGLAQRIAGTARRERAMAAAAPLSLLASRRSNSQIWSIPTCQPASRAVTSGLVPQSRARCSSDVKTARQFGQMYHRRASVAVRRAYQEADVNHASCRSPHGPRAGPMQRRRHAHDYVLAALLLAAYGSWLAGCCSLLTSHCLLLTA